MKHPCHDLASFRRSLETAKLITALSIIVAASACGVDNEIVGGSCREGYTQCGLRCIDTTSDPQNCGECDNVCPAGVCENGHCPGESSLDGSIDGGETDGPAGDQRSPEASNTHGPIRDGMTGDTLPEDTAPGDSAPGDGVSDGTQDSCTPPYDTKDSCGRCGLACSAVDDCVVSDAGLYECVPHCVPSSVYPSDCNGECVDETSDPYNCGRCGKVCASGYCSSSECQGTTVGDIVVIGDDYNSAMTVPSAAKILTNAVFLPTSNPIQILSFEEYADPASVLNVQAILKEEATLTGRKFAIKSSNMATDIPTHLTNTSYDVLLVYDQEAAELGTLGPLGASWAITLATFTSLGGVVVSLDGAAGSTQEMPLFNTAAGLLSVSADTVIPTGTPLDVIASGDVIGHGVVTPYAAKPNSVSFTTSESSGANVTYVVVDSSDAGQAPVVVHKEVP